MHKKPTLSKYFSQQYLVLFTVVPGNAMFTLSTVHEAMGLFCAMITTKWGDSVRKWLWVRWGLLVVLGLFFKTGWFQANRLQTGTFAPTTNG